MSLGNQNVAFPRKLYDLIDCEPDELIEWSDCGDCFFIRDQDEFCAQVLSKYFRHTKLTSFQRQLNLYGFRRITKGPDTGAYSHPLFSRDDPSHVDTIKRVVRKGANGGGNTPKWNPNNRSRHTGASPNSSHSFPDVSDHTPAPFKNVSRQLSSSWPYNSSSTNHDDDDDDDDDEDYEEDYPKVPDNGNTYSKPYYTQSSRSRSQKETNVGIDVPNRRSHRYGTRGAAYEGDEMEDDDGWDGYPHSAPSPSGYGGGDNSMNMDSKSMPMPPSNQFGYNDKSVYRNQGGAPLSPHSHPPSHSNQFGLMRPTSSSDMLEGMDPLALPKLGRSASALSAELNVSLAGSETWNFDGNMTASGSHLDLKDLDDLDQFNFDASFTDPENSAFPMDL